MTDATGALSGPAIAPIRPANLTRVALALAVMVAAIRSEQPFRVYLELRKPAPDGARIARWMRTYVRVVACRARSRSPSSS